jgi:hypothetical protein
VASEELSPRARTLLAAVEREVDAREQGLAEEGAQPLAGPPVHLDAALLAALELAAAGVERGEIGRRLREHLRVADPAPALDAVFGAGSAAEARLQRSGGG